MRKKSQIKKCQMKITIPKTPVDPSTALLFFEEDPWNGSYNV